jgi:hypothetical protein
VWQANQHENAPPVDQSIGSEYGLARLRDDTVEVQTLSPDLYAFLAALTSGATLGNALSTADVDTTRLTEILAFLFSSSLVSSVTLKEPLG